MRVAVRLTIRNSPFEIRLLCAPCPMLFAPSSSPAPFATEVLLLKQSRALALMNFVAISPDRSSKSDSCEVERLRVVSACNLLSCRPQKPCQKGFDRFRIANLSDTPEQYSRVTPRHFGSGLTSSPAIPVSERAEARPLFYESANRRRGGSGN